MAAKVGSYLVEDGRVFEIKGSPIMVVSDLDDTMFGDDEASKEFKDFWERDARLRGSCLVYNTGRCPFSPTSCYLLHLSLDRFKP